jgi:hypothetical protein
MKGQQERSRECLLWPSFLHFFFSPFPAAAAAAAGGVIINYKYTPRAIIKNEETQGKA